MADWKSIFYPESRFGGFTNIDGTVAFYLRVNALAASKDVVLDFGGGQGTYAKDPVPIRLGARFSMFSVPFAGFVG
jgi:hypothetical protein